MSQRRVTRLTQRQVEDLIETPRDRRPELDGFSTVMRDWILDGMLWDRRRMQRLVRDMQGITDPQERRDRLRREVEQAEERERLYQSSIDRLSAIEDWSSGQDMALREERSCQFRTQRFRAAVEVWEEYPHEGTR